MFLNYYQFTPSAFLSPANPWTVTEALLELVKKAVYQVQSEQLSDMIKETVREAMQGVPAAPTDSSSFTEETVGDEKNYFQKDIQFAQFYDFED